MAQVWKVQRTTQGAVQIAIFAAGRDIGSYVYVAMRQFSTDIKKRGVLFYNKGII